MVAFVDVCCLYVCINVKMNIMYVLMLACKYMLVRMFV